MLLVREVRALAGNLSNEDFRRQIGPFVLVTASPRPEGGAGRRCGMGVQRTRLSRSSAESKILMAELLQQFDDLGVATLPHPRQRGAADRPAAGQ